MPYHRRTLQAQSARPRARRKRPNRWARIAVGASFFSAAEAMARAPRACAWPNVGVADLEACLEAFLTTLGHRDLLSLTEATQGESTPQLRATPSLTHSAPARPLHLHKA